MRKRNFFLLFPSTNEELRRKHEWMKMMMEDGGGKEGAPPHTQLSLIHFLGIHAIAPKTLP